MPNLDDMAEALARRAEAEASVFRDLASKADEAGKKELGKIYEQRAKQATEFGRQAAARPIAVPDPEGTPFPLADRRGNYAATADQANMGGIGVFDSNTREIGPEEGTPSSRLNPEILRGDTFAPGRENNLELPEGNELSEEESEEAERQQALANVAGAGFVGTVQQPQEAPRRGRPPKAKSE